jgi:hypothetical protein
LPASSAKNGITGISSRQVDSTALQKVGWLYDHAVSEAKKKIQV